MKNPKNRNFKFSKTEMFRKLINEKARKGYKGNDAQNIKIRGQDIGIPVNLPTAIIGDKGSGKTTLVKTLMEETQGTIFNHIYFIYSNLSFDDDEDTFVTKIPVDNSEEFLQTYFKKKSIFYSFTNFIEKIEKVIDSKSRKIDKIGMIDDFLKCCDTSIFEEFGTEILKLQSLMRNPDSDPFLNPVDLIDGIILRVRKEIKTLMKPFQIMNVKINGIKKDERDAVIIDDIAIASKVLFKSMSESVIYKYLTLTRHMRLFILFAGQQVDQIPKYIRREIMCWLFSKNTSIELLKGIFPPEKMKQIIQKQSSIGRFEFVLFNTNDGKISEI